MLRDKKLRSIALFSFISIMLLGFLYYQTNPAMQRYYIHLIPFFILWASYGGMKTLSYIQRTKPSTRYALRGVLAISMLWQLHISYTGLHNTDNNIWFTPGYESYAPALIKPYISDEDIIIASFPEPYFLQTQQSVQSIADDPPFVYISNSANEKRVVIVEDEGMRYVFPHFTKFLHTSLNNYTITSIPLSVPFRYADTIGNVFEPIRLYGIRLDELKKIIETTHEINYPSPLL